MWRDMGGKIFGQIFTPHFIDTVKKRNSRSCSNSDAGMSTSTNVLNLSNIEMWDGHADAGVCGSCGLCVYMQICGCGWKSHPHEQHLIIRPNIHPLSSGFQVQVCAINYSINWMNGAFIEKTQIILFIKSLQYKSLIYGWTRRVWKIGAYKKILADCWILPKKGKAM